MPHNEKSDTVGSSMAWNMWSGFEGEGIYLIFNKSDPSCISLLETSSSSGGTEDVHCCPYRPYDKAQLWRLHKSGDKEIYLIENLHTGTFLTASGNNDWVDHTSSEDLSEKHPFKAVSRNFIAKALWAIDTSICSLEPGNMVL
ncbi:MAG: hypothetical protein Q9201_002012 [Fulgogasparrea decipioides]